MKFLNIATDMLEDMKPCGGQPSKHRQNGSHQKLRCFKISLVSSDYYYTNNFMSSTSIYMSVTSLDSKFSFENLNSIFI